MNGAEAMSVVLWDEETYVWRPPWAPNTRHGYRLPRKLKKRLAKALRRWRRT